MSSSRAAIAGNYSARRAAVSPITSAIEVDRDAFMRDLAKHMKKIELRSEKALTVTGIAVQNTARKLCPVDTGRLRASIFMRPGRDAQGFYVEIGTNVAYAAFVEFGTSKRAAVPYLTPALAYAVGYLRAAVV